VIAFGSAGSPPFPSKIVAVGRNYREHAAELGNAAPEDEPLLFLKAPSALVFDGGDIVLPPESERVDYEGELALVIGRRIKAWPEERWQEALAGVACANDVTARDLQAKDVQFTRAKGFDTFCPLGPHVVTDIDGGKLEITCRVNGEVRQQSNTSDMVFGVAELIEFISSVMTLLPGDVILTGTPAGISPLHDGDNVEIELEQIGVLGNPVRTA
jgi:2-keto-4-pentenoate hydratase/2-oxohepta-3-ene-1,7-dioic acid hydratase in catechol pathway